MDQQLGRSAHRGSDVLTDTLVLRAMGKIDKLSALWVCGLVGQVDGRSTREQAVAGLCESLGVGTKDSQSDQPVLSPSLPWLVLTSSTASKIYPGGSHDQAG